MCGIKNKCSKSSRIFLFLAKIFKDLWFSCQDLQGSFIFFIFFFLRFLIFLPRSLRIFKIFRQDGRKVKDPWRSWQENERSSKILTRIWKILKEFSNIFKGSLNFLSKSLEIRTRSSRILTGKWKILKGLDKNFDDPWRSWQENETSLKILARKWKILEDLNKSLEDLQRFW